MRQSRQFIGSAALAFALMIGAEGCARKEDSPKPGDTGKAAAPARRKAALLIELPDYCNTPDGLALCSDGSFLLSVPNYNDPSPGAFIMKISPDNEISKFFVCPPHPETGVAGPMGVCIASSGDIYYADNQFSDKTPQHSRVMRIVIKDGRPQEAVTVVSGMNVANAVAIRGEYLYVSETMLVPDSDPLVSGVFRFRMGEACIELTTPLESDPHLIGKIVSFTDSGYGADGLCFDDDGNLYCGNFADGTIHRFTFGVDDDVTSNIVWVNDPTMKCADGLFFDAKDQRIIVADMIQNAIHFVYMDGRVETLAMNGDTNGADGSLDQPCEAIRRGNEIIVSNMDWPFPGIVNTTWEKPYTLSVIRLER